MDSFSNSRPSLLEINTYVLHLYPGGLDDKTLLSHILLLVHQLMSDPHSLYTITFMLHHQLFIGPSKLSIDDHELGVAQSPILLVKHVPLRVLSPV